jgi:hypothetical protein
MAQIDSSGKIQKLNYTYDLTTKINSYTYVLLCYALQSHL